MRRTSGNNQSYTLSVPPGTTAFPWIIWYIWKARNEKIFENIDKDPLEVLRLAENEAQLWQSAQIELHHETHGTVELVNRSRVGNTSLDSNYSGYRCFVDGSWKESDKFSGTGWFCTSSNGEPPTMGAANLRRSLSPLHTEFEALLWAMKCMIGADNQEVEFLTDCSDLVKMVSSPTEWPAFSVYLEEFQSDKEEFSSFSLSLISRNANVKADHLAQKISTSIVTAISRKDSIPVAKAISVLLGHWFRDGFGKKRLRTVTGGVYRLEQSFTNPEQLKSVNPKTLIPLLFSLSSKMSLSSLYLNSNPRFSVGGPYHRR
ncbi:Ribonuclease H domain [Arabidopsis thaliana x Arabidopsis arenosa]|uniref:Ribonuclease H domain n=1 Tax=Arabidopsis thaliana x Arabidopsis arenosa TaxID=1240361 RepID=A0A8T2A5T5_9BRAS|nr:Ribonuclease H domain [Arabidopsis thaliana x Arabidopsis arenosa]